MKPTMLATVIVGMALFLFDSQLRIANLNPITVALLDIALFLPLAFACLRAFKLYDVEDLQLLRPLIGILR